MNHPRRSRLPYKVYGSGKDPLAAFAFLDDSEHFALERSKRSSITYKRTGPELAPRYYYRGEEKSNG